MTQTRIAAARAGLVSLAVLGLAACSNNNGASTAAAPPPPPPPTAPVAQATIRDVQRSLQSAGYYKNGSVDGVWGRMTQRALSRFQHDHNLTANGKLDVPTLQALNVAGTPPSVPTDNTRAAAPPGGNPASNEAGTNPPPPPGNPAPAPSNGNVAPGAGSGTLDNAAPPNGAAPANPAPNTGPSAPPAATTPNNNR